MSKSIIQFANDYIAEHPLKGSTPEFAIRSFALETWKEGYQRGGKMEIKLAYPNSSVKAKVTCEGLVYGMSGFAEAMRNIAFYLDKNKVNVNIQPIDAKNADSVDITTTEKGQIIDNLSRISYAGKGKNIRLVMTIPEGIKRSKLYDYQIAYIMFETKDFPKRYIEHLNSNTDEIWTPSRFNVENIKQAGWKKPIYYMPLGVDTDRFNPDKVKPFESWESAIGYWQDRFIFLSIMGWSERKGIAPLIEAYLKEFNRSDNVVLYIKGGWYDPIKARAEVNQFYKKIHKDNSPYIVLDFNIYKDEDLPKLYKSASAFVLASRGEGWGLNYTEAMSMGLPTIGTACTSQVDFMNDENSYPVKIKNYKKEPRCNWVCADYVGAKFANPDIDDLRKQMRNVYMSTASRITHRLGFGTIVDKGKIARQDMIKKWNWENATKRWIERLKEIANGK